MNSMDVAQPTNDAVRDAPRGWLAFRFLGIAAAFIALSLPVARIGDPDSPAYQALAGDGSGADQAPPHLDFAILGNSRPHVGLSPQLIGEGLAAGGVPSMNGWNFAVDGTDSMHNASFAEHGLLEAASPPRVVIWAVDPLMFDASRKSNRLEQLVPRDLPTLIGARAPLELTLDVGTMSVVRAYRHRPLVLAKVEDRTEGVAQRLLPVQRAVGLEMDERPAPRQYLDGGRGFEPFLVLADWEFRFYQRHGPHYASEYQAFKPSEWHPRFVAHYLLEAARRGETVVLLEMPVSPYYRQNFAEGAKHRAWREQMKSLAASTGALFVSDAERYSKDSDFGDPGHMHRATAEDYSRALGIAIAADPRFARAARALKGDAATPANEDAK